jgi:hypothetical protein
MVSTDSYRLAALIESSAGPSPLLDARLLRWGAQSRPGVPTASLEAADAFCQAVAPGTAWTLLGGNGESTGTITAISGRVCCVAGHGASPALALLAAFVRAYGSKATPNSR